MDRRLLVARSWPFVSLDVPVPSLVVEMVQFPKILRGDGTRTLGNLTLVHLEYNHSSKNQKGPMDTKGADWPFGF